MLSIQKPKIVLIILVSAMLLPIYNPIGSVKAQSADLRTVENNFTLQFNRTFDNSPKYEENRTIPNVDDILNNITSFIGPNMSVYTGSQIPTKSFPLYHYRLTAIRLHVINDHDTFGAGDMFLKGWVNQMIDDQMSYSEQWRFDLGQFNNGDNFSINCPLFDGWANSVSFWIELYDDDSGLVDTFGTYIEYLWHPLNTIYIVNYSGDAYMQLRVEILDNKTASAQDILDAYKPYLYSDVETSYDDPAEFIFGRVIEGRDPLVGKNTTCLQYLYYFPYEYTGSDKFVHYDDYEMVLIYLDLDVDLLPYRLVWDNGFYFSSSEDWIDGQKYYIYEDLVKCGTSSGSFSAEVEFFDPIKPLIGNKRTMNYEVYDISFAYDSGVERWGIFEYGMPTFQATIETSYHQFDLGDAGGRDPMDMNRSYVITPLTDGVIKVLYSLLNDSWGGGIHQPNGPGGAYTPIYAPFSWDLAQPFKRPYILNNYPKLCVDINAYQGAETKKSQKVSLDYAIELSLEVPISLSVDLPKESKPGDTINSNIKFKLNESAAKLIISPSIKLSLDLAFFFYEMKWNTTFNQQIIVHLGTGEIEFMGFKAKIFSPDEPLYQSEPRAFGNYVQFQYQINPKVVGEILSVTLDIGLGSLITSYIPPPYSTIIKAIFDEITLSINPIVTGYLKMDILAGLNPVVTQAQFNSSEKSVPVSFTMPEGSSGAKFALSLSNLKYGINFATHWTIQFDWAKIPSIFVENFDINLGTWPSIHIDLAEGTAIAKESAKWNYDTASSTWKLENYKKTAADIEDEQPPEAPGMIGIDMLGLLALVTVTSTLYLSKRMKKNN